MPETLSMNKYQVILLLIHCVISPSSVWRNWCNNSYDDVHVLTSPTDTKVEGGAGNVREADEYPASAQGRGQFGYRDNNNPQILHGPFKPENYENEIH